MPGVGLVDDKRVRHYLVLVGLLVLHCLVRWLLAQSHLLDQADYDESITGLMALHWLRGDFQAFFWGQPYMGTLEPLLAAGVFWLFGPSIFALHNTLILVSCLALLAVYGLGREVGGPRLGLLAALFWALPPLFLSFDGLYATGGHLEAVTASAVVLYGACRLAFRPPSRPRWLALGIGVVAGLGWWCSLLVASLLAASVLGLLAARPRLLRGWTPWVMLAGFLLGSAPFWWWNLTHDFMTFRAIEPGSGQVLGNLYGLLLGVWLPSLLGAWWDRWSVEAMLPRPAVWGLILLVYLPVLGLALGVAGRWLARLFRWRWPLQGPLDLVVGALLAGMLAHAASSYGATGFTRYAEALFPPLAVLVAVWLDLAWCWRRVAGVGLVAGLCAYNLGAHYLFLQVAQKNAARPVDGLIAALKAEGVSHAYAQGRIAYTLAFESAESILCADYFGWRNYDYLAAVDASPRIALITSQELGNPQPREMAEGLAMLGGQAKRGQVGAQVFWCGFVPPPASQPVPVQDLRISAGTGEQGLERFLADRDQATVWPLSPQPLTGLALDLGQALEVSGITLLLGPDAAPQPFQTIGLRLESSQDGQAWQPAAQGVCLVGLVWEQGQPRLRDNKALEINFTPRAARYLRLAFAPGPDQAIQPPLAEIFVRHLSPDGGYQPPASAREAYRQAQEQLSPWFAEPKGPHPRFPGVPAAYRAGRVDWAAWLGCLRRAILAAPDWEAPQLMLARWFLASPLPHREVWPDGRTLVLEEKAHTGTNREGVGLALLSGQGALGLRQGLQTEKVAVQAGQDQVISLAERGAGPGADALRIEGLAGQPCLRELRTPLDAARAYLETGQPDLAAAWLDRCGPLDQLTPRQLLDKAWCQARLGLAEPAARTLAVLEANHPALLAELGQAQPGRLPPWPPAWGELAGDDAWRWRHGAFIWPAVQAHHGDGQAVACPEARSGLVWRMTLSANPEQAIKVWLPQFFLRGGYLVSFRVRGRSESPGALAAFSVVRHYQNRPHDETARLEWAAAGPEGEFQEVVLPVRNDLEPVRLEARVLGIGRGELEVDQISIYPDLGGDLAAKRMEIEKVLDETGRGILDARAARP